MNLNIVQKPILNWKYVELPHMTAVSPLVSGILFLGFLVIYLVYQVFTSPKARYPPGPRPYPIIGNLLDVPPKYQEKVFANLAKKYGAFFFKFSIHSKNSSDNNT